MTVVDLDWDNSNSVEIWAPPRDLYDPSRFYSGDAIKVRLTELSHADACELLRSLDVDQLRPFVIIQCLQLTYGEPVEFYDRALDRLAKLYAGRLPKDQVERRFLIPPILRSIGKKMKAGTV